MSPDLLPKTVPLLAPDSPLKEELEGIVLEVLQKENLRLEQLQVPESKGRLFFKHEERPLFFLSAESYLWDPPKGQFEPGVFPNQRGFHPGSGQLCHLGGQTAFSRRILCGFSWKIPQAVKSAASLRSRLEALARRYEELNARLCNTDLSTDEGQSLLKEQQLLQPVVHHYGEHQQLLQEQAEAAALAADPEMQHLAKEELLMLTERITDSEKALQNLLLSQHQSRAVQAMLVEIRAAAGGDEAALFAEELMQMYLRHGQNAGWKVKILDLAAGNRGGVKESTIALTGQGVHRLSWESGVHRVQRVPLTETQGRIHTSTVTVAVLDEVPETTVHIRPTDIELQVMRSTGSGGQSVNTTDSAVRLIHRPTGVVVKCQQEKSQQKNRTMAMRMLRAKIYALEQERLQSAQRTERKNQVGTGDRSEKIRTYNFPQDRITDHRAHYTQHNLSGLLSGNMDPLLNALQIHFEAVAK